MKCPVWLLPKPFHWKPSQSDAERHNAHTCLWIQYEHPVFIQRGSPRKYSTESRPSQGIVIQTCVCVCVCLFWNLAKCIFSRRHVSRFPGIIPGNTDKQEKLYQQGGFNLYTKKNLNSLSSFWRSQHGFLLAKSKTTSCSLLITPPFSPPPPPRYHVNLRYVCT